MRTRTLAAVAATVLALALAPPAGAIINGQPDQGRHPYVGAVFEDGFLCSGSLISPRVFVTAGHCTATFQQPGAARPRLTFAEDGSFGSWQVTGEPHTYPGFCQQCKPGGVNYLTGDVGVVTLDAPVARSRYAQLPSAGAVDALANKSPLTYVGYGIRDSLKRFGDQFFSRYFAFGQADTSNNRVSGEFLKIAQNPSQGTGGICFGDSGGPVLRGSSDTVLAVPSYTNNVNCTGVAYAFRIDQAAVLAWIRGF